MSITFFPPFFRWVVALRCLYSKFCPLSFPPNTSTPSYSQSVLTVLAISRNSSFPGSILSLEAFPLITFPHFLCTCVALQSPQTSMLHLFFFYLGRNLKTESYMWLITCKFIWFFFFPPKHSFMEQTDFLNLRHGSTLRVTVWLL